MTNLPPLAVTGSTGAVGGMVARELAGRGFTQRLLVRSPDRAPELQRTVVLPCGYDDEDACSRALEGATTLFMVSASETADRVETHRSLLRSAKAAGVQHVVYTSFYNAAPDCTFTLGRDHFLTEEYLRESGMRWTFLRDNLYLDVFPLFVGDDDVLRGPAGDGRVAAVAREDVARCAAAVLTEPAEHRNATYDLTGPEALTLTEIARTITEVTGRSVRYHHETVEEAYESRRAWEAPQWQYDAWVSTYTAIAAGELDGVTDDVQRLTGRAPIGLAELLRRQSGGDSQVQ